MLFILVALFVIGPIAEIYVLLQAGSLFGVWPVFAACVFTAIVGGFLIRLQGVAALNRARSDLAEQRAPVGSVVDGVLLLFAAPFLMTPGFLTDAVGFALLIPFVRQEIGRRALLAIKDRIDRGDATITIRRM
ncbi:MAG: FxsA family protein [Pseudomonadota bacterium]